MWREATPDCFFELDVTEEKRGREEEKHPQPQSVRPLGVALPPYPLSLSCSLPVLHFAPSLFLETHTLTHTHTGMVTSLKPQMHVSRPEQVLDVSPQPLTSLKAHKENRLPPSAPTGHT